MATLEEKARFDTRLSKEQKLFFERAASIGGYRNLTDFIVHTVQQRAKEIIEANDKVIASQMDSEIFFNAITQVDQPNESLKAAANEYNALLSK